MTNFIIVLAAIAAVYAVAYFVRPVALAGTLTDGTDDKGEEPTPDTDKEDGQDEPYWLILDIVPSCMFVNKAAILQVAWEIYNKKFDKMLKFADHFFRFPKDKSRISERCIKESGLNAEMVDMMKPIAKSKGLKELRDDISKCRILVGHNLDGFVRRVVEREIESAGLKPIKERSCFVELDTAKVAQEFYGLGDERKPVALEQLVKRVLGAVYVEKTMWKHTNALTNVVVITDMVSRWLSCERERILDALAGGKEFRL